MQLVEKCDNGAAVCGLYDDDGDDDDDDATMMMDDIYI